MTLFSAITVGIVATVLVAAGVYGLLDRLTGREVRA